MKKDEKVEESFGNGAIKGPEINTKREQIDKKKFKRTEKGQSRKCRVRDKRE